MKTTSCIMHGRQSSCLDPFQSTVIHLPNPSNIGIISCFFRICYQKMQTLNFPGERLLKQFNSLSSSSKLSLSLHCHLAVPKHQCFVVSSQPMINHIIDVSLLDGPGLLLVPFHLSSWYCVSPYLNSSPSLSIYD